MNASDQEPSAPVPDSDGSEPQAPGGETERARPGLKAMQTRTLGWIATLAMVPVVVTLLVVWPLTRQASELSGTTIQACERLHQEAVQLANRLNDMRQELVVARTRKVQAARTAHRLQADEAIRKLSSGLAPLLKSFQEEEDKSPPRDKLKQFLNDAPEVLLNAVILGPDDQVLVASGEIQAGPVSEKLPVLAQAIAKQKESPGLGQSGWHWTRLDRQGHRLAVRLEVPAEDAATSGIGPAPSAPPSPPVDALAGFEKSFTKRAWVLSIALIILALGLGGAAFWWLVRGLLAPLQRASRGARQILEDPAGLDEGMLTGAGMTEDLTASLLRLRTRMQRLEETDARLKQEANALGAIRDAVQAAAEGNLARRVDPTPGATGELGRSFNRLLDAWTEQIEAFRQVSLQLDSSATRLHKLADGLGGTFDMDGTGAGTPSPGSLGDVLGTQLKGLCDSALELVEVMTGAALPLRSAQERKQDEEAGTSLAAGLHVLVQRIDEGREAGAHLTDTRQEAEVLFTNLAIAAEARSWTQLEKLVDETRALSRSMLEASDALTRSLNGIDEMASEIGSTLQKDDRQGMWTDRLLKWEEAFEQLQTQRQHLERQIDIVRPAAASLGQEVRQLMEGHTACRQSLSERRETIRQIGEGARALGNTASELLRQLDKLETGKPAPAAVTRELARQQRSLDRALRDLASVAEAQGIESLTSDAQDILERIRAAADQARERILHDSAPRAGGGPGKSEPQA